MSKPRGILVAGNWKMNHGPEETARFFKSLGKSEHGAHFTSGRLQACICPPMLSLARAKELSRSAPFPIQVASQNTHWEKSGAFTGEVSGAMLKEVGVDWSLVGHS